MALFTYECPKCQAIAEVMHSVHAAPYVACSFCNLECAKVILKAPGTIVPASCRAVQSSDYYGKTLKNKKDSEHINFVTENPDGTVTIETTNPNGPQFRDDSQGLKEV
jgi:predicted nucleic acid-binding Zn ribbon protein